MTTRQWDLYKYLKANTDRWVSQKEIVDNVEGYTYHERANDRCPAIRDDKIAINESLETDKLVVMKNYMFKLATREEYLEERAKHIRKLKNQVKQIQDLDYKADRNNFGKLLSNRGDIIDEKSKAKRFFDSFVESEY